MAAANASQWKYGARCAAVPAAATTGARAAGACSRGTCSRGLAAKRGPAARACCSRRGCWLAAARGRQQLPAWQGPARARRSPSAPASPSAHPAPRRKVQVALQQTFMPAGYPHTVGPKYLQFAGWQAVTNFATTANSGAQAASRRQCHCPRRRPARLRARRPVKHRTALSRLPLLLPGPTALSAQPGLPQPRRPRPSRAPRPSPPQPHSSPHPHCSARLHLPALFGRPGRRRHPHSWGAQLGAQGRAGAGARLGGGCGGMREGGAEAGGVGNIG